MLIECGLTMERHNALGVILGDSYIVVDTSCLCYIMSHGILLCWHIVGGLWYASGLCSMYSDEMI